MSLKDEIFAAEEIDAELEGEGLNRKINALLRNNRSKGGARAKGVKVRRPDDELVEPRRFRITAKEERILKRLATQTGWSENEIAYYFFHVGIKREFEKERDKFDLSKKVRSAYREVIEAEMRTIKESIEQWKKEQNEDFELLFWMSRQTLTFTMMLRTIFGKIFAGLPGFKDKGNEVYLDYVKQTLIAEERQLNFELQEKAKEMKKTV